MCKPAACVLCMHARVYVCIGVRWLLRKHDCKAVKGSAPYVQHTRDSWNVKDGIKKMGRVKAREKGRGGGMERDPMPR